MNKKKKWTLFALLAVTWVVGALVLGKFSYDMVLAEKAKQQELAGELEVLNVAEETFDEQ